jgi:hypothetical protein
VTFNGDAKKLFWQFDDPREARLNERHAMIFNDTTGRNLRRRMAEARAFLEASPDHRKFAADYADSDRKLDELCSMCYRNNDTNSHLLKLLRNESRTIDSAVEAGEALADFQAAGATDPAAALEALAEFGSKITETFNSQLSDLFGGLVLRALGSMVFLEAAKSFDNSLANVEAVARLNVTLLEGEPDRWRERFLEGKEFEQHEIALEQPIVNV